MTDGNIRGHFLWHELLTLDVGRAQAFYGEVLGWDTAEWGGGEMPYILWRQVETDTGGLMVLPEEARTQGAPPHWLPYIGTPSVDTTVTRARAKGARVLVDGMDVPEVGRLAVLQDPQGAVFAVFTPAQPGAPPANPTPRPGDFTWHELATSDHAAAFGFYSDLFGWRKAEALDMGDAGIYQMYGLDAAPMGGIYNKPPDMPAPPHWLTYIRVSDLDATVAAVKEAGGTVVNGPMEVPGGDRVAQCVDSQGAAFALHGG